MTARSGAARDHHANAAGLREMYASDADARRVIDMARGLEGLRRQDSIHAAAVVISPVPLTDIVPIQQKGQDAEVVTQFEMHAIEELGLLKMDFLGLRNLSTIERALELIEENHGERPDIDRVPLDDPAVYEMLSRGDSMGIFQMEGTGMRALMRNLQPDRFDDLIALISLYRPGPLGAGTHNLYADRKNSRVAGRLPPPRPGTGARRHLRDHGLPGAGDGGRPGDGGVLDGRGRCAAQGDGQEDPRGHGRAGAIVRRRLRRPRGIPPPSAGSCSS